MELKEIQELIKFIAKSGVSEFEIETKTIKLKVKNPTAVGNIPVVPPTLVASPPLAIAPVSISQPSEKANKHPSSDTIETSNLITVKSPMIGTFYRSPGPDKPVFVNVGDEIKKGQVLCIIEAMKLFNEIESEVSGRIVKVLADDSTPVEYDQPLFLVEPA